MEFLIVIAGLWGVGCLFSAMHGLIKPVVDWVAPQNVNTTNQTASPRLASGMAPAGGKPRPRKRSMTGSHTQQRPNAKWWATYERKRRLRAAIAEHTSKPKPPRYLP